MVDRIRESSSICFYESYRLTVSRQAFTIGSVAWCINGFFIFLPFVHESLVPNVNAIGWTEWLGATIFFFAAWPEVWEALFR